MLKNKWWVLVLIVLLAMGKQWLVHRQSQHSNAPQVTTTQSQPENTAPPAANFEHILQQAYQNHQSDLQIQGSGRVIKTLPDDTKGTRHQRFIVKLTSGQTLLFAHNIDLAPKIRGLKKGDTIAFNGEYEWSEQGGVIHWTHKDPNRRHVDGWLEHNGQRYE